MSSPTVSVVIPAYNREDVLTASVDSVLRQTWTDFEVLIVDDGSTDATREIAESMTDPRIRVVATSGNTGASGARNVGVAHAVGDWVAFQDSDDEWLPRKLEKQMAPLLADGSDAIAGYCGMVVTGRHFQSEGERPQTLYIPNQRHKAVSGDIRNTLLTASLVSTQTLIVRRDLLAEVGGFDEALPALVDWDLTLRLAQHGSFSFIDEPLVLQFFSQNSLTQNLDKRLTARRAIIGKHRALFEAAPDALAYQYRSLAGEERRRGNIAAASEAIAAARKQQPLNLHLALISVYLRARRLFGRD